MDKKEFYIKESLKLFLKYGIKSVTIGQITAHLNISSKTLYNLFGDKSNLVKECFTLYNSHSKKAYQQLIDDSQNLADMLVRFYSRMVESLSRINPNFFNDISRYFPEIWDSDEAFGIHRTRMLLEQGVKEGIFVKGIQMDICAETLTILAQAMFEDDHLRGKNGQQLLNNVIWPYVRGLCTPEGLEEFRKFRRNVFVS